MRVPLLACLLLLGCATSTGAGVDVANQAWWKTEEATVTARASFELNCPSDKLTLTRIPASAGFPFQLGVTGCEHRLVYVHTDSGWVLNSSDATPK